MRNIMNKLFITAAFVLAAVAMSIAAAQAQETPKPAPAASTPALIDGDQINKTIETLKEWMKEKRTFGEQNLGYWVEKAINPLQAEVFLLNIKKALADKDNIEDAAKRQEAEKRLEALLKTNPKDVFCAAVCGRDLLFSVRNDNDALARLGIASKEDSKKVWTSLRAMAEKADEMDKTLNPDFMKAVAEYSKQRYEEAKKKEQEQQKGNAPAH